jgi:hypothetical protein
MSISNFMSGLTDWWGLTDTKAPQRGLEALEQGSETARQNLQDQMDPVTGMYQSAMRGRQMGDVLDQYQQNMMGTEQAAGASNVEKFMNPMYQRAIQQAGNQALAGAGSSLQSSGANNAVANTVANTSTNMWQQAFQNAMADAQNKQGIYGNVTQANLTPSNQWAQLTADLAGTQYNADMGLANAGGQVAGQNTSWFGSLF